MQRGKDQQDRKQSGIGRIINNYFQRDIGPIYPVGGGSGKSGLCGGMYCCLGGLMGPPMIPDCWYGVPGEGRGWGVWVGGLTLDFSQTLPVVTHNSFGRLLLLLLIPLLLLQMVIGEVGSCKTSSGRTTMRLGWNRMRKRMRTRMRKSFHCSPP